MAASKGPAGLGALLSVLVVSACAPDDWQGEALEQVVREDPDVAFESLGSYSEFEVKQLLDLASLPGEFDIDRGISMYRVLYSTTAFDGEEQAAAVAIVDVIDAEVVWAILHASCAKECR